MEVFILLVKNKNIKNIHKKMMQKMLYERKKCIRKKINYFKEKAYISNIVIYRKKAQQYTFILKYYINIVFIIYT